jgi:thioredoxin reductase (NADPH)
MLIVNPTFGTSAAAAKAVPLMSIDWTKDAIALFSNSKPNARELLEGVMAKLGSSRPIDNIGYFAKNSASQPAPAEMIDEVAKNYRGALLALGD